MTQKENIIILLNLCLHMYVKERMKQITKAPNNSSQIHHLSLEPLAQKKKKKVFLKKSRECHWLYVSKQHLLLL